MPCFISDPALPTQRTAERFRKSSRRSDFVNHPDVDNARDPAAGNSQGRMVVSMTELLPLLKPELFLGPLTDLPDQWLQCQVNGSNVCQNFRLRIIQE